MAAGSLHRLGPVATSTGLGDGRIDNIIVDRSVHLTVGVVVLVAMAVTVALVGRHAIRDEAIGRPAGVSIVVAQVALIAQVLLGIKLLDQGQGIVQLYIHYVGGLTPLGAFLVGGWLASGDSGRSSRVLAVLLAAGMLSAYLAFFIGRAYVNRSLA